MSDKVFARKCKIVEISSEESKIFCHENHIQGYAPSSHRYGLCYNEELVAVATFCKSRYDNKYKYELLRFCNKKGLTVVGGFSKLIKNFKRTMNVDSIVTYANRRWSTGNVYNKFGRYLDTSSPNYFYFSKADYTLQSRLKYQKHKLQSMLPKFDPERTEKDNMWDNGYRVIYDCGNLKYAI